MGLTGLGWGVVGFYFLQPSSLFWRSDSRRRRFPTRDWRTRFCQGVVSDSFGLVVVRKLWMSSIWMLRSAKSLGLVACLATSLVKELMRARELKSSAMVMVVNASCACSMFLL